MRQLERLDPNLALAAAAVAIVATEAAYRTWISDAWLLLEALVAAAALFHAWREQDRLRLGPVLAVIGGLQLALFGVHLALDVIGDKDSSVVYRWQGNGLVRGEYPRSEYPLGAVLLFGLEAWLGGGTTRNANALLMVPLALVTSAAVWLTRAPYAPWLAALIGFWPANSFYWQYKFDLAPAALLVVGLLLALRGRWGLSGVALAAGTLVKWTPALAAVALVAWLLTTRRVRDAATLAAAFAATLVLVYAPFLVWSQSEVLAAYERQSGRSITPESVWYLLLRPFDLAHVRTHISFSAGAPRWANVGGRSAAGRGRASRSSSSLRARARSVPRSPLAALVPVAFLLTNRIFSPQFVLVAFAAWAFAAALVVRDRREQLWVGVAMAAAALANEFVYPFALPRYDVTWVLGSLTFFTLALALTASLAWRASRISE